ncbi:pyridoxal-dependent decarboxylase, exosortase A system-associated [Thalassotalea marina]|uniref:Pyridoxal-dependent decarboxylase, exosortase A system-associated n=1 Tax=Thalassotalea marina TaxID=1673741 RepID=A0A919BF88_9GAMM|nr:pyridoxal-dependent decarboxylase, exosortase A system-associated [Thalassotalea marina]GHF87357.1 pyridoxal-dependent decarboxylase, exosortase A system-associated [Thalassotalea marina]
MINHHEKQNHFGSLNNQLMVQDKNLTDIDAIVGQTPFYVYDSSIVQQRITTLVEQLPKRINLHYAIKANPYLPLVHFIKPLVKGFDVASKKEMLLALESGMPANHISFAGPGKSDGDLTAAILTGVILHAESLNEIKRAIAIGKSVNRKPNIAIRVNPAFELKASGMKMAGGAKPFGVDEEVVLSALPSLDYENMTFKGFHIYAGSQNLDANAIIDMHNQTFELALKLVDATPVPISHINLGGGFGVPYFAKEKALNIDPIANNLHKLCNNSDKLAGIDLIVELGRYLVAEAGLYVCKVVDKKVSRDKTYLVCDGGLHHHLANSGNFGQVIRKNYPLAIGNKLVDTAESPMEKVDIVGPLCTPLDIIGQAVELPKADVGDYIVVFQSGAYGASASPKDFLSQPHLSEILF